MRFSKTIFVFALTFIYFLFQGCEDSFDCESIDPDLVNDIISDEREVMQMDTLDFDNETENIKALECLETLTANESQTRIIVEFRRDMNSTYSEVFNQLFDIPQIVAAQTILRRYGIVLESPGEYNIITIADGTQRVRERDEDNNQDSIDAKGSNRLPNGSKKYFPITVKLNPEIQIETSKNKLPTVHVFEYN